MHVKIFTWDLPRCMVYVMQQYFAQSEFVVNPRDQFRDSPRAGTVNP